MSYEVGPDATPGSDVSTKSVELQPTENPVRPSDAIAPAEVTPEIVGTPPAE
jgi:hypothetical protein